MGALVAFKVLQIRLEIMAFFASFLIRRLAQAVVIIFLVTILIFAILRIVPGDPVRLILGPWPPRKPSTAWPPDWG